MKCPAYNVKPMKCLAYEPYWLNISRLDNSKVLGLTIQRFNISQAGHFIASTLYKLHIQLNISQVGRFIVRMSHWQDVSYRLFISRMTFHGQNLYQEYISQAGHFTKGHFLDRTFHWQCISLTGRYTGRTFHWQDISQEDFLQTGHFTRILSIQTGHC